MDSMMDALFAATLDRSPHTHRTPIGSDGDSPHVHRTRTRASIPLSCLIPDFPSIPQVRDPGTSIRVAVVLRRLTVIFRSSKPILRGEIQLTRRACPFSAEANAS